MLINEERFKTVDLEQIYISARLYNIAKRHGISNLYELLESYYSGEFATFRNAGIKCLEELEGLSINDIPLEFNIAANDDNEDVIESNCEVVIERKLTKEIDYVVVNKLIEDYGFKISQICKWYGITRQAADMRFKHSQRKQAKLKYTWEGFECSPSEEAVFQEMINRGIAELTQDEILYEYYSNLNGDMCFIVVSPEFIKSFFLQDMPESIRELVAIKRIAFFSYEELNIVNSSTYVMRLKEKYLIPCDKGKFVSFARKRKLSPEEYSLFIAGCKLGTDRGVTDDKIIAFFEENMNSEGKVHIKADPKNQWIKSYASRNGFGINEFISFYGYESALSNDLLTAEGARQRHMQAIQKYIVHDDTVYIPCTSDFYRVLNAYSSRKKMTISDYVEELGFKRISSMYAINEDDEYFDESIYDDDESDMQIHDAKDDFIERIFAENPLLGNYIFSEKNLAVLNNKAKNIIDKIICSRRTEITERDKQILALSVINYAKKWDTDKGPFTSYIIKQYGYRSEDRVYYPIIGEVFSAISDSNRWCFSQHGKNQYKSTIMIHAMGSMRSWMTLCDFLSDFYQNNLGCNYDEDDPYILRMVLYLRNLFYKLESEENDNYVEFTVGKKPYSFQEGIRKLVVYRPNYASEVFSRMICRIDESMSAEPGKAKTYEDVLVDIWLKNKKDYYSNLRSTNTQISSRKRSIAYTYSNIRPEYVLLNSRLYIELPDIRVENELDDNCTVCLENSKGIIIFERNVDFYGNELGRTIKGFSYDLSDYLASEGSNYLDPRIIIRQAESVIYDSGSKLRRKTICFCENNECAWSSINAGKYTIVANKGAEIAGDNIYITSEKTIGKYRITDVELDDNYVLTADNVLVSYDKKVRQKIQLLLNEYECSMKYYSEGQEYIVCNSKENIGIRLDSNDTEQKYLIILNDDRVLLSDLSYEDDGKIRTYKLPSNLIVFKNRLQIIDMSSNKILFDKWFAYVSSFICSFNRDYYFSRSELRESTIVYTLDGIENEIANYSGDESVELPYADGNLIVYLPIVRIESLDGSRWKNRNYYANEIDKNYCLRVIKPSNISINILLGNDFVNADEDGLFYLGEAINTITDKKEVCISLVISNNEQEKQRYELGKVEYKEAFISAPKLEYTNKSLIWDCGFGFIGEQYTTTLIDVYNIEKEKVFTCEMDIHNRIIKRDVDFEDGEYTYEIYRIAPQMLQHQILAEGKFVAGDVDKIRFKGYQIEIDQIVFDNAIESGVKNIMKAYIDCIEYDSELSKTECSEGICPRYTGIMYFINPEGKRHDYAFEKEIRSEKDIRLKTNPVHITYINDGVMLITDCDDDALMYRYYVDRITQRRIYHITDHEMNDWEKDRYDSVDLVRYKRFR
ncbi:hypothetical protein SAMN02910298_00224 [Pseudobutyrivibrio sp. YE44]|uniref:hypothetical protein n=1 Tax=Pseudobutyrivibrio sp. YE44 TaxID=1520802 RepID=UPI00088F3C9E|nr:hypothetical protein [Pseudobutyrivibrio sp. YE44]SDB07137.1 hypothetical protein SAMN02910298_00224 [Pseudobutyrivibrio sp. YE44]